MNPTVLNYASHKLHSRYASVYGILQAHLQDDIVENNDKVIISLPKSSSTPADVILNDVLFYPLGLPIPASLGGGGASPVGNRVDLNPGI